MSDPLSRLTADGLSRLETVRAAQRAFDGGAVLAALQEAVHPDAVLRLGHPIGETVGADALYEAAYAPLIDAFPDLERRDWITFDGVTEEGDHWLGCAGHYVGTFLGPWLDIPPTGHIAAFRFHEFYRLVDGRVAEMQALWDIPELMMRSGVWPMAPSLGHEWLVPGPLTQDGLQVENADPDHGARSLAHVRDMLNAMTRHPKEPPTVMELPRFWHSHMNWYGPAGIGSVRGIAGFRHWHQIPFLKAMPDRGGLRNQLTYHFFAKGDYVAVTGWPNMAQTVLQDGWLGLAPAGRKITLNSLDFWRLESGKIRENWVMLDMLDVYRQLGVDVLARMREFNKARVMGRVTLPAAL
ncbi:MAG: ester cyclase [Pseudomonadota bacterium]